MILDVYAMNAIIMLCYSNGQHEFRNHSISIGMLDVPTSLAHKFSLQQTWTNPCLLQSAHHWLEESMAQDLLKTWTHESGP